MLGNVAPPPANGIPFSNSKLQVTVNDCKIEYLATCKQHKECRASSMKASN